MRVVLLTGAHPARRALAWKLTEVCDLTGIVVSENVPRRRRQPVRRALNGGALRLVGRPLLAAWTDITDRYDVLYPDFPDVERSTVRNINDYGTLDALEGWKPDLVAVSGTNMIGKRVLGAASERRGAVNLHTGLSPYVKGGPNCTNWCLAERKFHLIGNTVMWLDPGIDTGRIIATKRTPLTGGESLAELHWRVMEHAHELYRDSVSLLATGLDPPGVAQDDIATGRTYYNAEWTGRQMVRARWNHRYRYPSAVRAGRTADVTEVALPGRA
jgi:folate-dependent phosphoribosylglycinamide formyltransferase PurN